MKKFLFLILLPLIACAADPNRLKDKTEATTPASDDYFYLDGATGGVRKYKATKVAMLVSPAFTTPDIGVASGTSLKLSSLHSGRLPYITTQGLLTDSSALLYDDSSGILSTPNLNSATNVIVGTGANSTIPGVVINGGADSSYGPSLTFNRGGSIKWQIATDSVISGSASNDLVIYDSTSTTARAAFSTTGVSVTGTLSTTQNATVGGDLTVTGGDITLTGASTIAGGAGNMIITSGTGNSRTLTFRTTTSGGTATNAVVLGADQSASFAAKLFPATDDGAALGDTTHNFSDLFLASGAVINFANSNWVATHASGILTVGTGDLRVTTAGTNTASVVTVGGAQSLTSKKLGSLTSNGLVTTSGGDGTLSVTVPASGILTFLGTSTSANLATAVTDETGSGALVFGTSPAITTSLTTGSTTFALLNSTATTVNAFGATTTLNLGASATMVLNFGGSTTASEFRFLEPSGSGTNYTAFKAQAQSANITYILPAAVGSAGQVLTDAAGNGTLSWTTISGSGDVTAASSFGTDNVLIRSDGTGKGVQASGITIDDSNNMSGIGNITASGGLAVTGSLNDTNNNELLIFTATASAVNEWTLANAATGNNPKLTASGGDSNVGLDFQVKGTGVYRLLSTSSGPTDLRLFEDTDNGSNYASLIAPASLGSDVVITLPNASSTLPIFGQQITFTGPTAARSIALPDAAFTVAGLGVTQTWTGINTFSPAARSSGTAAYVTWNAPADTGITAATESVGEDHATATRTWATTGTVTNQREVFFRGKTYASASASQTFTDISTVAITPPIAGTNAIFTRGHSLQIVDSTSASSSITGGFVIASALGTTATSVGIGGGNINAGGTITGGGAFSIGTSNSATVGTIELGAASDTTLSRSAAGVLAVEGVVIPSISSTNTLTNKRVTSRITTISSSATPTVNTDNCDIVNITALAAAITSATTNLTGTPVDGDQLEWRILDNGTARSITWGASFASGIATLPTTTTLGKTLYVYFEWDAVPAKWMCQATGSYP